MKTAIIYARVSASSEGDDSDTSCPDQIRACEQLAKSHGLKVIGTYQDLNRSGRTWPKGFEDIATKDTLTVSYLKKKKQKDMYRDGLAEVIKQLPKIDVIIVREVTRLYRPVASSLYTPWLPGLLLQHQVDLLTTDRGTISHKDVLSWCMQQFLSSVVSEEISNRKKFSQEKRDNLRDNGYLYSRRQPYGYKSGGKQQLTIIKEEIKIVKEAFVMFDKGMSVCLIAKTFNGKYKPRSGKAFTTTQIRKMLTNELYIGKQYTTDGRLIESKVVQAVVSELIWQKAKKYFKDTEKLPNKAKQSDKHPLIGLVYCGYCGHVLYRRSSHKSGEGNTYYRCPKSFRFFKKNVVECVGANINSDTLLTLLLHFLPCLNQYKEATNLIECEQLLVATNAKIEQLQQQEKSLLTLLDNPAQAKRMATIINTEMEAQEAKRIELMTTIQDAKGDESLAIYLRKQQYSDLCKLPVQQQMQMFRQLFDAVRVYDDYIEIDFKHQKTVRIDLIVRQFPTRKMVYLPTITQHIQDNDYAIELQYPNKHHLIGIRSNGKMFDSVVED